MKIKSVILASSYVAVLVFSKAALGESLILGSIDRIRPAGSGFVQLVYKDNSNMFLNTENISSLTGDPKNPNGCLLKYSDNSEAKVIEVKKQNCSSIIKRMRMVGS